MECNSILVRYDEIALKGKNRSRFEQILVENISNALKQDSKNKFKIKREHGRIFIRGEKLNPYPLKNVFGITSLSPSLEVKNSEDQIVERSAEFAKMEWQSLLSVSSENKKFRVSVQRGFKSFSRTSMEIEKEVGATIQKEFPNLMVDLKDYDLELGIDIRSNNSYIYTQRLFGFRGLPIGSNGRLIALISGGIDSPVAAWMMMKRGCPISFVHFHSPPFTGPAIKQKIIELITQLKRFQNQITLYFVPFADIQLAIKDNAPEKLRTILYRRAMHRIADKIRIQEKGFGIVTGDSIGQVSSQTVENLQSIMESVQCSVYQPLIGMDKVEIIERAKKIGTFDISIQDVADCCTLFTPKSPATRSNIEEIIMIENILDLEPLIMNTLTHLENVFHSSPKN